MANRRMISKSISVSKKLASIPAFPALLFTWMIPHCDDGGNIAGDAFTIKALVMPARPESVNEIDMALMVLWESQLIQVYSDQKSQKYFHIVNWEKHQTLRKDRESYVYPPFEDGTLESGQPSGNQVATTGEPKVREDKEVKRSKLSNTLAYLTKIPEDDMKEFLERFVITEKQVKSKAEDLKLYCERKGRKYSNYKSFLLNALKRDFKEKDAEPSTGKYSKVKTTKV